MKNTINWAIGQMKNNIFVRRSVWPEGTSIGLQMPDARNPMTEPFFYITDGQHKEPWFPNHADLLALDWEWAPGQDCK